MNILNKIAKILLMIIIFLCVFTITAHATMTGKIVSDNIRLRKEPNTESNILTLISINEQVEVIEKEEEWYKISYKNNTGYIEKEFMVLIDENNEQQITQEENVPVENDMNATEQQGDNQDKNQIETNKQKTVANTQSIYILPLIHSSNIGEIQANTEIELIQNTNGWSYVAVSNISGWIRTDKLIDKVEKVEQEENKAKDAGQEKQEETEEQEEGKNKVIAINKTGYIKKASVNFRKGPTTESEKIGSLTLNTEIKVVSEENGWYKIEANKKSGYVLKELVSFEKVEVTSRNLETPRNEEKENNITSNESETVPTDKSSSNLGKQIVDYALTFVGYPYVYGGSTPSGFDCSGFTSYVYKHFGYSISRSSSAQASNGVPVAKADLQPGDLVLFKGTNSSSIGHVGIYIGGNQFVHASTVKTGVKISSLSTSGYIARYVTARRII